ncbi:MAG: Spy/CpxP family protein refolding chaperone [Deltaproteobacteria bacterium]|jgi:protein CpxP|nr:Spy/CpxP family protein refolding chaperone [Deltaproteobacteria bacterium]MCW8892605.1 Spy/CpxP family protein refolding chaperone [Deltaproteobacteria bacterium]MCW9049560.1 Spy/CpxP family protein refolding chaperone [Deltaproteobacteria bacterium]
MKKITTISALLIALLFSAGSLFAWSGHHGGKNHGECDRRGEGMTYEQHEERMENRLERMAVILDLTEKQKEQLEDLHEKNWQDHQAMRAQMQESRNELHEYKFGKEFNEAEFRAKAQKHANLKTEMMVQRAQHKQDVYAVLTPDQQVKAEKLGGMLGKGFEGKRGCDRDGCGKRGENRECDGHGRHGGKGSGQRYNN